MNKLIRNWWVWAFVLQAPLYIYVAVLISQSTDSIAYLLAYIVLCAVTLLCTAVSAVQEARIG